MIKFLKDLECEINKEIRCGDGCCLWYEWDGKDFFKAGETACEPLVNVHNLEEGIDFEYVNG